MLWMILMIYYIYMDMEILKWPCSLLARPQRCIARSRDLLKIEFFYRTHEGEQGTSSFLQLIKLVNLMTSQSIVSLLYVDYGHSTRVWLMPQSSIYVHIHTLKGVSTLSFNKAWKYDRVKYGLTYNKLYFWKEIWHVAIYID